uniref:acyl-CoA thioesterase n=1 Tax=Thaumasiovibrio occultus TaxID=1891184 RepID=UPI000B34F1AF|nr:acyl-CoA thioesterase [Thaumasiovibrio occultus]
MEYQFVLNFKVRDYECDLQGIVNNSVYQNYLEHARHEFLLERGVDFAALARDKINLVVTRAELDYLTSLTSGDEFWVGVNVERVSKVRFAFHQHIFRSRDDKPVLRAVVTGTSLNERGRPTSLDALSQLFDPVS